MAGLTVDGVVLGNDRPLVVMAGLNVLEHEALTLEVASALVAICARLGVALIFKASWDKANRTSVASYRGPGLEAGLAQLQAVRDRLGVPIMTDVHEPWQAAPVSQVVQVLQVPAFLVRQTDLVAACAATGLPLHLKKMQMLTASDMAHAVHKARTLGATGVMVCERGTAFGPGRLVVDPLEFPRLKALGVPVTFDVTHSLQRPGGLGHAADGNGPLAADLAVAGVSQGLAALFLETHPDPAQARCDGPSATPLHHVEALLERVLRIDRVVKGRAWRSLEEQGP